MEECARGDHGWALVAADFGTSVTNTGWAATIDVDRMDGASIEKLFDRRYVATRHPGEAPLCTDTMHLEQLFVCLKMSLTFFPRRVVLTI
jgi:hypothetical protein